MLTFISINVFFEEHFQRERTIGLCNEIINREAQVVALQEVIRPIFQTLQASLSSLYHFSPIPTDMAYFTVLLVKKTIPYRFQFVRRAFTETNMGRDFLYCELFHGDSAKLFCVVGTIHLESTSEAAARASQSKELASWMKGIDNVIVGGDFNICSYTNYPNKKLPPNELENFGLVNNLNEFIDLWPKLNAQTGDLGYTFLGQFSKEWTLKRSNNLKGRYDRIFVKSSKFEQCQFKVFLVANHPIGKVLNNVDLFISDHFGIGCSFNDDIIKPSGTEKIHDNTTLVTNNNNSVKKRYTTSSSGGNVELFALAAKQEAKKFRQDDDENETVKKKKEVIIIIDDDEEEEVQPKKTTKEIENKHLLDIVDIHPSKEKLREIRARLYS